MELFEDTHIHPRGCMSHNKDIRLQMLPPGVAIAALQVSLAETPARAGGKKTKQNKDQHSNYLKMQVRLG